MFKPVADKMDVTVLSTIYLGTRQVNLRDARQVKTPADLKGVKLRMPGVEGWLFLGEALGATATPLAFGEVYLGAEDRHHRRPGQPAADRARGQVLRGDASRSC